MKPESLDPRDAARQPTPDPRPAVQAEPATADREVPLAAEELPPAVHAYLDGDKVADAALSGAERELELWKRISAETGRRRRMLTPAHLQAQILAKLSDD